jgi:CheY-like chemotaxis protein
MEEILRLAGYRCLSARNGREAVEAFDHERPDIVLTDISMPVMDGLEEVASIRARSYGAAVPIVAVTAHALGGDREFALREGCTEYLAKPYRPRELLAMVERLLKEGGE